MDDIDPKILKIVALAKAGVGGEKEVAIRMVKQICEREGIDFDELMSDHDAPKEYSPEIKVKSKDELRICIQVAARFATTPQNPEVRGRYYSYDRTVILWYTCKPSTHIDTLNAISVYLKAYRAEKKKFMASLKEAFTAHHNLYSQFHEESEDDEPKERTLEERQNSWRAAHMMQAMTEQVKLTKEIDSGEQGKV